MVAGSPVAIRPGGKCDRNAVICYSEQYIRLMSNIALEDDDRLSGAPRVALF
jgi:hypothetical protein